MSKQEGEEEYVRVKRSELEELYQTFAKVKALLSKL